MMAQVQASNEPDNCANVRADKEEEKGKENEAKVGEFCFECKSSLAKSRELINVTGQSDRRWHPECFKCRICGESMDKRQSCHVYKDQIVCRTDYMRLKRNNSIKCKRCHWPIGASDWVRKAADYVYHLACFNCDICFRQLNTGEQFVINTLPPVEVVDGINASPGERNNVESVRLMCKLHFTVDNSKQDGGNNVVDRTEICDISPESSSLSPGPIKTNKPDHLQLSIKHQCKQRQRHQVMKSDHFHLLTPSTASCSSSIMTSNHQPISTVNSHQSLSPPPSSSTQLTTQLQTMSKDFSLMTSSPNSSSLMIDENFINQHHRIPSTGSSASSSTASSSSTTNLGCASGSMTPTGCGSGGVGGGGGSGLQSKSKRVRTTFTEDQLSILQTHFQIDSNPDGQDLERIATITGLSKRVTQVWFQNSRARQKKYMIKRKPGHGSAASMGSINHGHHHHHHGSRQHHHAHQSLVLVNQSMDSPGGNSHSPNLELSNSPMDQSSGLDHQRLHARFGNFSHQFHEISFSSGGSSELKTTIDKENDATTRGIDLGERKQELIEMESDDGEEDGPDQFDNQGMKEDSTETSQSEICIRSTNE